MTPRFLALAAAACLALAVASLLAPAAPAYDAWAWLVWGRELAGLELDTSSGPSFKPLPVAIAALLSPAGDAAPAIWLVLVRASFALSLVLAGTLAYRLAAGWRWLAAGFAALSVLLLYDEVTPWTRQAAIGMSEPVLVALVLGAIAAALARRPRAALALAGLAALLRPEAWPLLAAFGWSCWRADRALRPWLVALALAVPAVWIVPDLLGSGGAAGAGERALRGDGTPLEALLEALRRAATMPLAAAWPLAALALLRVRCQPAAAMRVLAAGALAWIATVAVMAAAGFAGLPRFMAPALAVVGILAGAGLSELARRRRIGRLALAAALVATAAQLPSRAGDATDALAVAADAARRGERLRALVAHVGRTPLLACGKLATSDVLQRTALAWELRVPIAQVVSFGEPPSRSGAFVVGPAATRAVRARLERRAVLLGERGEWRVYSLRCSPAAAASSARSAGVTGARR